MQKRFENKSGDLVVRKSNKFGCGVVEILHLWDDNKAGCTIGYWEKRGCDGEEIVEFKSVGDRFITTKYDYYELPFNVLRYGQKLAEVILESDVEE